jgi:hypothetical protein
MAERKWFTGREAGEYFNKSYKTMLSLAARELLPKGSVIKLGRELRFDVIAIEKGAVLQRKK